MNDGFHSQFVSDALTQRQLYVENAKTALHDEREVVMSAVMAALILSLGRITQRRVSQVTKAHLREVIKTVLEAYDAESEQYTNRILRWLELYVQQEASYMTGVMNRSLEDVDDEPSNVWPVVLGGVIGATGLSVRKTLRELHTKQRVAIEKVLRRAYAQSWTVSQVLTAFRGTGVRRFKDGLVTKLKRNAAATVDTVVQFGMSAARYETVQKYLDWTLGYTWVSVLDSRTSATCRALSGRVFKYGAGPIPPMHYRCRSHIMPVFKRSAKLRNVASGAVNAGETYYEWLKRQPKSFQEDVLGPTWSKLFRDGGLSADEFAAKVMNRTYRPMTLDEMRKKAPEIFARAGV